MTSERKKILIVDDEENLTWIIAKNLRNDYRDHDVYSVNSGDEALDILKRFSIDLVISDIQMPGTDGLVLLDYVKKNRPEAQVIIMTSLDSPEIRKLADQNAGIYYFEKPFEMAEFKKTIQLALKKIDERKHQQLVETRLKEVIMKNYQNKFNGLVSVHNGNKSGIIYFRAGEIIHAQVDDLEGEMALINVLNWKAGHYHIVLANDHIKKRKRTIYYGWKLLLKNELQKA